MSNTRSPSVAWAIPHASRPSFLRRAAAVVAFGVALPLAGCGGAVQQASNFPTQAELLQLAAGPTPTHLFEKGAVDVEKWTLTGPLPDQIDSAVTDDTSPWTKMLTSAVAAKPGVVVASRAMACLGRETALFLAEKKAQPAEPLLRFMAARCGVPSGSIRTAYLTGEIPEATSEAEILTQWGAQWKDQITTGLGAGARLAGVGFARKGKVAAAVVVSVPRLVHLENLPLVPTDGKVVLRGELLNPAESVRALVTRGRFGYEVCVKDIGVQLPRFAIECPVSPDDPWARIEVAGFPAGRELGDTVLDLRVYPSGKPETEYAHAAVSGTFPAGEAALSAALLENINAVRKEAGLGLVRPAEAQARTALQLTPYYFAALSGNLDITVADKVALGMLAGWDVDGMVREGHFTSQSSYERDVGAFVESAISSPFGRETLLDPAVSRIAVGAVAPKDSPEVAAVFGTYAMLETGATTDTAGAVIARLTKLRGKIKRSPPDAAPEVDAVITDVVARLESGISLEEALKRATSQSLEAIHQGAVRCGVMVASSVDKLEIPSELLSEPSLRLGVGVARYKPEGFPWTKLAVIFVMVKPATVQNTARAGGHAG